MILLHQSSTSFRESVKRTAPFPRRAAFWWKGAVPVPRSYCNTERDQWIHIWLLAIARAWYCNDSSAKHSAFHTSRSYRLVLLTQTLASSVYRRSDRNSYILPILDCFRQFSFGSFSNEECHKRRNWKNTR